MHFDAAVAVAADMQHTNGTEAIPAQLSHHKLAYMRSAVCSIAM